MNDFWKAAAMILVSVILCLTIGRQEKEIAALLALTVVCITGALALRYLEPVFDLMRYLQSVGNIHGEIVDTLMRIVGIAVTSDMVGRICLDSGFGSLNKSIQLLGGAAMLSAALPLVESLITLVQDILGNL